MNPSHDFLDCLGWTLLHFLWQGLIIAALAAGALRLFRRHSANTRYLISCFALLLMATAPVATFYSLNRAEEIPTLKFTVQTFDAADTTVETPRQISPPTRAAIAVAPKPIAHKTTFPELLEASLPWLVAVWSLGVLTLSCRLFAGWVLIQKLRRSATLIDPLQARLKQLAAHIGVSRPIRLLQSACVEVPAVIGWLRPVILLPASCLVGLTPAQLESILAHELAHIRRHDYLINLLQNIVETLLFYHPAVWWVSRRIRTEREHCCDDLAVKTCGDAAAYARALATLEELRPAPAPFALAAAGAPLLERIRRLAGQPERSAVRPAWPVAGIIALLLLVLIAVAVRNNPASAQPATESPHTNQNVNASAPTNSVAPTNALATPPRVTIYPLIKTEAGVYTNGDNVILTDDATIEATEIKSFPLAAQPTQTNQPPNAEEYNRSLGEKRALASQETNSQLNGPPVLPGQLSNELRDLGFFAGGHHGQYVAPVDPAAIPPETRKKLDQQLKAYQDLLRGALTNQNSTQLSNDQPLPEINIKTKWAEIDVSKIGTNTAAWPFNGDDSLNLKSLPGTFTFSEFLILKSTNAADPDQFIYLHNQTNSGPLSILLSDTRYQSTLKKLEQQDGVDLLTAPEVTTESGRQCQIQAVDVNNISIGSSPSAQAKSPGNFTNQPMPFGPVLDVIPRVSSDRRKIELTIVASVTEFVGYEDPATVTNNHGKRMPKGWAIPHLRLRQFRANLAIENAQTMALGSSLVPIAQIAKPKKYVLGLFHSKATTNTINKTLLLLITPTLVNPDGTRFVPPPAKTRIADLVRDGKLLYEAGKLDEAEAKLKQAAQADPPNLAAYEYLRLIKERRIAQSAPPSPPDSPPAHQHKPQSEETGRLEPRVDASGHTLFVYTSKGRQAILSKLDKLRVDNVAYDHVPLGEVISDLARRVKAVDPDKNGIQFFISREAPGAISAVVPGTIDPATGLPAPALSTDVPFDFNSVVINIDPALKDVRLADVLNAITKCSNVPIRYSILDYAVVFSLRNTNEDALEIRTFHVDPRLFRENLENISNLPRSALAYTNGSNHAGITFAHAEGLDRFQVSVRKFFTSVGVDFSTNNPANVGKAFVWGDKKGVLTVRATASDLDMIAAAIEALNQQLPLINLKVKVALVDINTNAFVRGFFVTNLPPPPKITNYSRINENPPQPAPHLGFGDLSGVMNESQYQVVLQALKQGGHMQVLDAPELATESAHLTSIDSLGSHTNSGWLDYSDCLPGIFNGTNSPITNWLHATIMPPPFPILKVFPTITADEFHINLTVNPEIMEFVIETGDGKIMTDMEGNPKGGVQSASPHFRQRRISGEFTVPDGGTAMMGIRVNDLPPGAGDPLLKAASVPATKNLLIFVTATLTNPDGTPYHTDQQRASFQTNTPAPAAIPGSPPTK